MVVEGQRSLGRRLWSSGLASAKARRGTTTATYLVLKLDKCETFADALLICRNADPLQGAISFEELAQILFLDRSRDVGDVQFPLVRVGIGTALLARRVRDLSDEAVTRLQLATVKRERGLRMCLSKSRRELPFFEPITVEMITTHRVRELNVTEAASRLVAFTRPADVKDRSVLK